MCPIFSNLIIITGKYDDVHCTLVDITINNIKPDSHYQQLLCPPEATFGFNPTYSVSEDIGNITVAVSLLSGILARDLIVSLLTLNGTAMGKSHNELS